MLINLTIPVFNEEIQLRQTVLTIQDFLARLPEFDWQLSIANNASTDDTLEIAYELRNQFQNIEILNLNQKGRGLALKRAWLGSDAEVLSYMDVDLSSDLEYFPRLLNPVIDGSVDLSIGSRLLKPELTQRGWKRQIISQGYNSLIKIWFGNTFSDAQCGFKAISQKAARTLIPLVENNQWFFDTELLLMAENLGFSIHDLPVAWRDDPSSTVKILSTACEDLQGLWRMKKKFLNRRRTR